MVFEQGTIKKLDDYFTPLAGRPQRCVYFYRFAGTSPEVAAFIRRCYEAARRGGVVISGRIPNPDPKQLAYFSEMMGQAFRMEQAFFQERLQKWLPRMSAGQREAVAGAMFATLEELQRQGKNENMLRNAYIKYMCWLYYRFERILNRLGAEDLPKILYCGAVSRYELQLLAVLSRAGADIALLEPGGDGAYGQADGASAYSKLYQGEGLTAFPPQFTLKEIQNDIAREAARQRLCGPLPRTRACTNAWLRKPELEEILTAAGNRGGEAGFFYNAFLAQYGAADKLTFSGDIFALYKKLKDEKRRICIVNGAIPVPTPEEVAAIRRGNCPGAEQLAGDLVQNLNFAGDPELLRLMRKAFTDLVLEEGEWRGMPKLTGLAVYLLCWLRRYQKELFNNWRLPEISVFLLFGTCATEQEACFLRLLARLPVDVVLLQPDLNAGSCLRDPALLEIRREESLAMETFPTEGSRVSTAAYQAERELDSLMYQDTGLYRNRQYAKAETVTLQTMYEEIALLWDQELKYRPSFQASESCVTAPVLLEKICGVKDGQTSRYWLEIKKLITQDTLVVSRIPWIRPLDPNPMKADTARFLQHGKLQRGKIKSHRDYPYGILREEMQEHLLDKIQLLLDRKTIAGTFQNGTEYAIVATALNLDKELLRLIQRFDFTKKNPKLILINTTEEVLSLEDSILCAYLNLVGFDILFFVPTGYQCIERHFTGPFANEQQLGEYLYDLNVPDFRTIQERGPGPIRKLFGRSH